MEGWTPDHFADGARSVCVSVSRSALLLHLFLDLLDLVLEICPIDHLWREHVLGNVTRESVSPVQSFFLARFTLELKAVSRRHPVLRRICWHLRLFFILSRRDVNGGRRVCIVLLLLVVLIVGASHTRRRMLDLGQQARLRLFIRILDQGTRSVIKVVLWFL